MKRYNLVPKILGKPTNYEWEANDDGAVVQADEAIELQRVAAEMADVLRDTEGPMIAWAEHWRSSPAYGEGQPNFHPIHQLIIDKTRAALARYAIVKGGK